MELDPHYASHFKRGQFAPWNNILVDFNSTISCISIACCRHQGSILTPLKMFQRKMFWSNYAPVCPGNQLAIPPLPACQLLWLERDNCKPAAALRTEPAFPERPTPLLLSPLKTRPHLQHQDRLHFERRNFNMYRFFRAERRILNDKQHCRGHWREVSHSKRVASL